MIKNKEQRKNKKLLEFDDDFIYCITPIKIYESDLNGI
jgi:hypothetical protein